MHTYSYIYIHTYKACLYQCYICKVNNVSYRGIKKYLFTYCKKKKKKQKLKSGGLFMQHNCQMSFYPITEKTIRFEICQNIFLYVIFWKPTWWQQKCYKWFQTFGLNNALIWQLSQFHHCWKKTVHVLVTLLLCIKPRWNPILMGSDVFTVEQNWVLCSNICTEDDLEEKRGLF